MRNKPIKIIFTLILSIVFCFTVIADSGWDTDYDSGGFGGYDSGGYDYGGGWDYDDWDYDRPNNYHSSSSSSGGDVYTLMMIFAVILIIVLLSTNRKNAYYSKSSTKFNDISNETLQKLLPTYTVEALKMEALQKFIDIQNAWTNFDYEKLRQLCSDELYNSYISELDVLKLKGNQNIMSDFSHNDIKLINIKEEQELITLYFYLDISFYDYVVDKDKKVVRGTDVHKINNRYYLRFTRSKNAVDKIKNCPNCGAPIKNMASQKCEYCGSTIVKSTTNLVLSKKNKF